MAKIFAFYAQLLVISIAVAVVSVKDFQIPKSLQAIRNWKPGWMNNRKHDHTFTIDTLPESYFTQVMGTKNSIYSPKPSLPAFLNLEPSWISPELVENSIVHHDLYFGPHFEPSETIPQQSSLSVYLNSQFKYPVIPVDMPTAQLSESLTEENDSYYESEVGTESNDVLCLHHNVIKPFAFVFLPLAALALSLNAASLFIQRKFYIPTYTITAVSTTTTTTVSTSISIQYSTEVSISTAFSTISSITTQTSTSVSTSFITSTGTITQTSTSTSVSTTTVTPPTTTITETSTKTDTVSVTETSVSTTTLSSTVTDISTTTLLSTSTVTTTFTTPSVTTLISVTTITPNTVSVTTTQLSTQVITSTTTLTTTSTITSTLTSTSISSSYQTCCVCDVAGCDCGGFPNCFDLRRKRKDLEEFILQSKTNNLPIQPTMAPVNTHSLFIDV